MKLYGKLIFWFVVANVVAVVVALLVSSRLLVRSYSDGDAVDDGHAAVQVYESQGAEALEHWLRRQRVAGTFGMLLDDQDRPLARGPGFMREPPSAHSAPDDEAPAPPGDVDSPGEDEVSPALRVLAPPPGVLFSFRSEQRMRSASITSASGRKYRWVAFAGPPRGRKAHLQDLGLHLIIGLLAIAAVALLAARRITQPIDSLREATVQLANGKLEARVPGEVAARSDEMGELGRSFNEMAARLQRLLESQRHLLRDVSHELRSPLARLRIASELAREEPAHFERIEQEADRLEELIGQMLLVARLDSPMSPATLEPVDVSAIARQVCEDAQLEANPRQVRLVPRISDGCNVSGRPDLLQSAIENVVRNAVRYTADGTTVDVESRCEPAQWRIVVSDHGPGVPEDQLAAIFKPFHRVSSARERDTGGYGLGLAIAERAVAAHGGTITAQNIASGGLRVEIRMPATQAA